MRKPIYERLAVQDIRDAADALRPVYDDTSRRDGYVSLEVSPLLAYDTAGTLDEARRLWRAVGRDNLMIKVPGDASRHSRCPRAHRRGDQRQCDAAVCPGLVRAGGRSLHCGPGDIRSPRWRPEAELPVSPVSSSVGLIPRLIRSSRHGCRRERMQTRQACCAA